jgi:hypothetical protein
MQGAPIPAETRETPADGRRARAKRVDPELAIVTGHDKMSHLPSDGRDILSNLQ